MGQVWNDLTYNVWVNHRAEKAVMPNILVRCSNWGGAEYPFSEILAYLPLSSGTCKWDAWNGVSFGILLEIMEFCFSIVYRKKENRLRGTRAKKKPKNSFRVLFPLDVRSKTRSSPTRRVDVIGFDDVSFGWKRSRRHCLHAVLDRVHKDFFFDSALLLCFPMTTVLHANKAGRLRGDLATRGIWPSTWSVGLFPPCTPGAFSTGNVFFTRTDGDDDCWISVIGNARVYRMS